MAASGKEKQLRDRYIATQKQFGKNSPEALKARGALNDHLESMGRRTNRLPGEPRGAAGGNDLTTPEGVIEQQKDDAYISEYGPTGGSIYTRNPDGTTTRTVGLSDGERMKLEGEQRRDVEINTQIANALSQTRDLNGRPVDTSGLTTIDPTKFDIMKVQEALMGPKRQELEKKHALEVQNLQTALMNRGIQPGSPRAAQEIEQLKSRQVSELQNAEAGSYTNAGTVAGAQKGLYDTALNQRGMQYQEAYDARNQPFMDVANLQGVYGQSGVNWPQFSPTQYVDSQGTALGFAGLGSDEEIARLNAATQKEIAKSGNAAQLEAARIAANASMHNAGLMRGGSGAAPTDDEGTVDSIMGSGAARAGTSNKLFGQRAQKSFNGRFF